VERRESGESGLTLVGVLIAVAIAAVLVGLGARGYRTWRDAASLGAAASAARGHLALARTRALARRETLRVRLGPAGDLETLDSAGVVVDRTWLGQIAAGLDSVSLHPRTLRFNARGQAAPGSLYLFRGRRVARIVCNFIGRLRVVRYAVPGR